MIKINDVHATPMHAAHAWQVPAPRDAFSTNAAKPPVKDSPDLQRVLRLGRRETIEPGSTRSQALVRMMSARFARTRTTPCRCAVPKAQGGFGKECITELNATQAWALYELGMVGGLLGPIGVGHGKTILDLLAALALVPPDEPNPSRFDVVLLVPPTLVDQLISEYHLVGEHFRMPSLSVNRGSTMEAWDRGPSEPVLHVIPYSRLQRPESTVLLKRIRPRAIVADEVHYLRNRDAVRTHRVLSYFAGAPYTRFAGWTGTITDSSLNDYGHLIALALREQSPLPLDREIVKEWASALDPKSEWPADPGELLRGLTSHGFMSPGEHIQLGFRRRLIETEGVVATKSSAITAELRVTEREAPPIPNTPLEDERAPGGFWPGVRDALQAVRDSKLRPDGEVLLDPLAQARCARELACGFFYRWRYPRGEPQDLIEEWFAARKLYRLEVRDMLEPHRRREHMDSPFLLQIAAMRHHGDLPRSGVIEMVDEETGEVERRQVDNLPTWASAHWPRWRAVKDLVKPETEAVRLDPYLAQNAAEWGHEKRGVIWYDKTAFGTWVAELSGLPIYGAGPEAAVRMIGGEFAGRRYPGEDGSRSIIASIKSHDTGRDGLQRIFHNQLVANIPSSATTWEQLLGRLHRIRQLAPVVYGEFYCHTDEMASAYYQAQARAAYIQRTIGAAQKLGSADDVDEEPEGAF